MENNANDKGQQKLLYTVCNEKHIPLAQIDTQSVVEESRMDP